MMPYNHKMVRHGTKLVIPVRKKSSILVPGRKKKELTDKVNRIMRNLVITIRVKKKKNLQH